MRERTIKKSTKHVLKKVRIPGAGKQLVWKCVDPNCTYADHGGATQVFGCPKRPFVPARGPRY